MKTAILSYLLMRSAFERTFTRFDIDLAKLVVATYVPADRETPLTTINVPEWLQAIFNLQTETVLPEAFWLWREGILDRFRTWLDWEAE